MMTRDAADKSKEKQQKATKDLSLSGERQKRCEGASANAHATIAATVLSLKRGESNLKRGRREVKDSMANSHVSKCNCDISKLLTAAIKKRFIHERSHKINMRRI